ncbi:MAG: choice-of-anchor L domain-containing protein [Bacteroidota bacterium]
MNHLSVCIWFCIFLFVDVCFSQSPVQITPTDDVEQLVLEEFIKQDNCIEVFNIRTIGTINSIGSFSGGEEAISVDKGIVFTTGRLEDIGRPNFNSSTTGMLYGLANAPYLQQAVRTPSIHDVVGIEFDFIPTNQFVGFNYVFASEEYCEFVGSEFNDAFGFFISGPGIEGDGFDNSINIAKIPESDEIVSINTVNHLENSSYFINNFTPLDANACNVEYDPQSLSTIEFDGFTTTLQAVIRVIPCETYRIRLVVGDVSDTLLDSAVFLEGKSFESTGIASVEANVRGNDGDTVYENCLEGEFIFFKSRFAGRGQEVALNYIIQGTATPGVDYELIPDTVTILSSSFRSVLPITIIPDTITEEREYIEIIIETITCDCVTQDTARLYIEDSKEDIGLSFDDAVVCAGQPFTFGPDVATGVEPLIYVWDTGDSTATITDQITSPQSYKVIVSDFCGAIDSAQVNVRLQEIPSLSIDGSFDWCEGRPLQELLIDLPGQAPWSLDFSVDGSSPFSIDGITLNPFSLPLDRPGRYEFVGFNDEYCVGNVQGTVNVEALTFDLEYQSLPPSCINASDGQITLEVIGGVAPFQFDWGMENQAASTLDGLLEGIYSVTVSDELGCIVSDSILVVPPLPDARCRIDLEANLYIPTAFSPNEDTTNDQFTVFPKFGGLIEQATFQIFDRWGDLIFQSETITQEEKVFWDGGDMQTGVYVCVVALELVNGDIEYVGQEVVLTK